MFLQIKAIQPLSQTLHDPFLHNPYDLTLQINHNCVNNFPLQSSNPLKLHTSTPSSRYYSSRTDFRVLFGFLLYSVFHAAGRTAYAQQLF